MTPTEATMLARIARAACPQQHFDKYTPDTWFDLLGDLDFEDAREALQEVAKRQPFVAPAEIRAQVVKVRRERSRRHVIPAIPDPDDAAAYRQRLLDANRAAGERPSGALAITSGDSDEVTARRAEQFRTHGYKPFLSGAGVVEGRDSHLETGLEAARRACQAASARIHARDPQDELTDVERAARERARAEKPRPRRGDPGGLTVEEMRRMWRDLRGQQGGGEGA